MKMLLSTAQTLPLYISESPGVKAPPLCGAVPAEPTYVAKVSNDTLHDEFHLSRRRF